MKVSVNIETREIRQGTDPILELVPMFEAQGFKLVANGVGNGQRFLVFEQPAERSAAPE